MKRKPEIFTIGHSDRTSAQFLALLEAHGVRKIFDIRTIPRSRHAPQFNQARIRRTLARHHIRYEHVKALGGLRHAKRDSTNLGWINASFRGFADYMQTPAFANGLRHLETSARRQRSALMCAEAVPWRCHRSLVADALTKHGWRVADIQSRKTARPHRLTPFLRMRHGMLTYPAAGVR